MLKSRSITILTQVTLKKNGEETMLKLKQGDGYLELPTRKNFDDVRKQIYRNICDYIEKGNGQTVDGLLRLVGGSNRRLRTREPGAHLARSVL